MSDASNPASSKTGTGTSLFGQASSTPQASSGGLFGSKPQSTGTGLFGNAGGTSAPPQNPFAAMSAGGGSSLFGQNSANKPGTTLFGQPTNTNASAGSGLFGSTPATSASQASQPTSTAPAAPLFGSTTPSKPAEQQNTQAQTPKSIFGAASNTGGSLFNLGNTTPSSATPASRTSAFPGTSTTPAGPPPGSSLGVGSTPQFTFGKAAGSENLFGKPASSSATGTPSLSAPSTQSTTTSSTPAASAPATGGGAANPTQPTPILFGGKPGAPPAGNLLGNLGKPQESSQANKPAALPSTETSNNTSAAAAPSLFGTTSGAPSFSFPKAGTTAPTPSTQPPAPAPKASPFSFGNPGNTSQSTANTSAGPSTNLFAPAKTQSTTQETTPAPTTSAPSTSNLFSNASKPAAAPSAPQSQPQEAPKGSAPTDDTTKKSAFSASTTGPLPPAQSRLKNKSMDEIITRWATDLSKYQKEFQSQAGTIAQWDRMLVDNSEKIQKLYGQTLEAERAMTEVERQLSAVENDQNELESWLEHYDREVDNMVKQQGDGEGASGPDAERQRTYQLAGRLTERLDEMGQDLGSIIEEINDASSTLSKNNGEDDPLSQVVRILNTHLTQLQQIDQGAAVLNQKIQAAQKSARRAGPMTNGSRLPFGTVQSNNEAADGFWKSYMGRR